MFHSKNRPRVFYFGFAGTRVMQGERIKIPKTVSYVGTFGTLEHYCNINDLQDRILEH
jgi:hypothetical protein